MAIKLKPNAPGITVTHPVIFNFYLFRTSRWYSPRVLWTFGKTWRSDGKKISRIFMAIQVKIDRSGRRGKTVTMITNIQHNPQVIEKLEKKLKQQCGAGGTSYAKTIEIQGEHVDKVKSYLQKEGYDVK